MEEPVEDNKTYHRFTIMLTTFQSVLSKALRAGGQSLDSLGRTFEIFPYVEKRE